MRELARCAVVATTLILVLGGSSASAAWQDTSSASMPIASGSLAVATSLVATPGCTLIIPKVTLSWTPTTSTQATGYRVFRRTGAGSYSQIATVTGADSSGYVNSGLSAGTSYTYYVQAYIGAWTADSATASATTPTSCL